MGFDKSTRPAEGRTTTPLRILVVDDHPIVRRGLVELINDERGMRACCEAADSAQALKVIAAGRPDVAIIDLSLGGESGLDLVEAVTRDHPSVRILVLSGHDERLYADRALKAGALGYIMKDRAPTELMAAVRRVAAGKSYVSEETAERILLTLGAGRRAGDDASAMGRLSNRERHVLELIGRGHSTRDIADQLKLSIKTVESHCARIKEKLGLRNSRELTRVAVTEVEREGQ